MSNTHSASASPGTATHNEAFPFTPKPPFFFQLSWLMVVAIHTNGRLIYKAQTKPNGPWEANWTTIDNVRSYAFMAAGLTGDGRVAVVAQPTSQSGVLYIDEKPDTMTQAWNAPFDLGKPAGVTGFYFLATAFDVEGRVEVFGTDTNGNIWWKYHPPYLIDIIAFLSNL